MFILIIFFGIRYLNKRVLEPLNIRNYVHLHESKTFITDTIYSTILKFTNLPYKFDPMGLHYMQYIIQSLTTRTFAVIHSHIYVDHKILHLEAHKMDLFHFQYMDMFFQYQIQDVLLT